MIRPDPGSLVLGVVLGLLVAVLLRDWGSGGGGGFPGAEPPPPPLNGIEVAPDFVPDWLLT